jgi:hypothetical protein
MYILFFVITTTHTKKKFPKREKMVETFFAEKETTERLVYFLALYLAPKSEKIISLGVLEAIFY